jgi:UDP-glucose 4-epimerase
MENVLVTGGAGYIGSHVVLELLASGRRPVVLDDLSTGSVSLIPKGIPFVKADIADCDTVIDTLRRFAVQDVIHCAASLSVAESMRDPIKYWKNNVSGSLALAEACVAGGVRRMVFSSTAAVYGDCGTMPVTEDQPLAPVSPYGTTKRAVEVLMADVCRTSGMKAVALRYFNVAGADPLGRAGASPQAEASLIRVACQAALGMRKTINIFGTDYDSKDGTAVRDFIHVCDLASVHRLMMDALTGEPAGSMMVVNCGYGQGVTVKEVVDATRELTGASFPVHLAPRRAGDIGIMVADTSLLRRRFRWTPAYAELSKIIPDTLNWERKLLATEKRRLTAARAETARLPQWTIISGGLAGGRINRAHLHQMPQYPAE